MVDLDKLLELESKATPMPWQHDGKNAVYVGNCGGWPFWEFHKSTYSDGKYGLDYCADGKLIEIMRNNFRQLCLELKAARKVVEAAREKLVIIYGPELQAEQPCKLLKALKELDGGK